MWNTVGIGEHPQYAWLDEQCIFLPDTDEYVDKYTPRNYWKSKNTDFTGAASVRKNRQTFTDTEIIAMLLAQRRIDLNQARTDAAGQTPLYTACYNGHTNWISKNTDFTGEASVRNYRQTSSTDSNWISKNTDFTGVASVRNYRQT